MALKRRLTQKPEILAPVGNWEMLQTAIDAGTDAVYLGIDGFNMRATARNFTLTDLPKITKKCHDKNVKVYLTANIIFYENELSKLHRLLKKAKEAKVDAIICWDFAVIEEVKKLGLEFHISTQASISNSSAAKFFEKLGASRFVPARECSIEQLKEIRKKTKMKIEAFAHGAMCVSVSGRCFMSQFLYGRSANRGDCIQPCRRAFQTKVLIGENEEGKELELGNDYVMSPKDLCTLPFLEKLVPYVDSLKIEGRARSPEYVKIVVEVYKEALDLIAKGKYTKSEKERLIEKVSQVYNRGFSDGFYMGKPINEWTDGYGGNATKRKYTLGRVKNYFKKIGVVEIEITAHNLSVGDEIIVIGPTTGTLQHKISSIQWNHKEITKAEKGKSYAIKLDKVVRKNDMVYLWK